MARSFAKLSGRVVGAALLAAFMPAMASQAGSKRSDIERREQTIESMDQAADQRSQQARDTADRQRQLIEYQIRKNRRNQLRTQCQLAGGGTSC